MLKIWIGAILTILVVSSCTPKIAGHTGTSPAKDTSAPPPPPPPPAPLPPITPSTIPIDSSIRIGRLSNGMMYYIKANAHPENRAELRLALKAGSMQEDEDQLGLAHFIEHMAFNGTTHFSKNELVNYLEKAGARFGPDLNAYTSFDETVYMLQVRTDAPGQLDTGLLILQDWAAGVSFDTAEIDKERGVVISEWRSSLSPQQRMQQQYLPVIYFNSRYATRLPIGDPDIVSNASYETIRRFYQDWYRPELMAVFVTGTIDPDQIEEKIKSSFTTIYNPTIARKKESNAIYPHPQTLARVITDPEATNANVQIIYKHRHEKAVTESDYRTRLMHALYNRMLGRRLSDISKEANPPFVFGYTGYSQDVGDMATYSSYAMAESPNIRRATQTLMDENQRVLQHGFTEAELEREKANILRQAEQNQIEEGKLESSRVIQRMVNHFLDEAPLPSASQHLEMYRHMMPTILVSEVNQLAHTWITDHSRVIILTAPEKDRAILPDSQELIGMLKAAALKDMAPYTDVDVSAPILAGTFPPQPISGYRYDSILDIHHWSFANGITVQAKPTLFRNDEILMNAYSDGGHSLYPDALYPSARSASAVVGSSGVGSYTATALEKKLTGLRVNVSPFIFERFEGLNGSSSVQDAETMMQLVYSYITAYREDPAALNAYLSRERGMFANLLSNPQNWFSEKVTQISTQSHPRRGFPTPESYDQIRMSDIISIYQDRFKDVGDMHFFFVGNFDPDSLQRLTSRYLAPLPGGQRTEIWQDVGARVPKGVIDSVYYRGEAPKTLVQIIYHGEDRFHPDSSYLLQSLTDLARIKLREELREEEGGVYGVSISGGQTKYPDEYYSIRISFNADPVRADELINSVYEVLNHLKEQIDQDDIQKVTEAQRQARIKDLMQNRFWMNAFITCWMNDLEMRDMTSLESLEHKISMLNESVLTRAARKYFSGTNKISVVMHPATSGHQ